MHEQRRPPMRLNIGSASIIMLFSVLCLTVLASLSLLSAGTQWKLAQRSANSVSEYYAADFAASEIYSRVEQGDLTGITIEEENGIVLYSYAVKISDRQRLVVELQDNAGELAIVVWKAEETGDWTPDDSILVWDGGN